jgi:hypothetical protein
MIYVIIVCEYDIFLVHFLVEIRPTYNFFLAPSLVLREGRPCLPLCFLHLLSPLLLILLAFEVLVVLGVVLEERERDGEEWERGRLNASA